MIKKIILFFIAGILLLLLPVFFILCTDESENGRDISYSMFCFSKKMEESLDELRQQTYPDDYWIVRHGKRFFPDWDRQSQQYYYKVIYDTTPPEKMIGFVLPNRGSSADLRTFVVTVDRVEELTGLDFFTSNKPHSCLRNSVEAGK